MLLPLAFFQLALHLALVSARDSAKCNFRSPSVAGMPASARCPALQSNQAASRTICRPPRPIHLESEEVSGLACGRCTRQSPLATLSGDLLAECFLHRGEALLGDVHPHEAAGLVFAHSSQH